METELKYIIRKTGRKPIECKCVSCKSQCSHEPCLGTPTDIEKIIDAGHRDKILLTTWLAGKMMGIINEPIIMYQPKKIEGHGCTFFKDGLCTLHSAGLKPTEGRLSHHSHKVDTWTPRKSLAFNVANTWQDDKNTATINRIIKKMA